MPIIWKKHGISHHTESSTSSSSYRNLLFFSGITTLLRTQNTQKTQRRHFFYSRSNMPCDPALLLSCLAMHILWFLHPCVSPVIHIKLKYKTVCCCWAVFYTMFCESVRKNYSLISVNTLKKLFLCVSSQFESN